MKTYVEEMLVIRRKDNTTYVETYSQYQNLLNYLASKRDNTTSLAEREYYQEEIEATENSIISTEIVKKEVSYDIKPNKVVASRPAYVASVNVAAM